MKFIPSKLAAAGALASLAVSNVMAAVPADVTTALGEAKTDGVGVATLVLVAIIAIFAFKFMRKGL